MSETELQRRQVTGTLHSSSVTSQVITKLSTNATQNITQAKVICFTSVLNGVLLIMNVKKNMKYHILGYIYWLKLLAYITSFIQNWPILEYIVSVIQNWLQFDIYHVFLSKLIKFGIYWVCYLRFANFDIDRVSFTNQYIMAYIMSVIQNYLKKISII